MKTRLLSAAQVLCDAVIAAVPRKQPSQAALADCKIVSHRGEHGAHSIPENTMAAFRVAREAGVWGIEADIRWTADLVPMVIHDPDTVRVFGATVTVANTSFDDLRRQVPEVPTLAELVEEFGRYTHLMLELKDEIFPNIEEQKRVLNQHLSGLVPERDYHILALDPSLFETFDIQPRHCCLPVAMANTGVMSRRTLSSGFGGLTGHYLLLNAGIQKMHEAAGQKVGTGFVRSRNCLYREINRGAEWIFSNDAVHLQNMINEQKSPKSTKAR
ncbi:MAG: glycerophosphodiester phosphodiesterase [Pseudomonadota bacterium]